MARIDSTHGKFISCALMIVDVFYLGKLLGSMVLEYAGKGSKEIALKNLFLDLHGMIIRRGYGNVIQPFCMYAENKTTNGYTIVPKNMVYNSLKIKKKYGTVLSLICFVK